MLPQSSTLKGQVVRDLPSVQGSVLLMEVVYWVFTGHFPVLQDSPPQPIHLCTAQVDLVHLCRSGSPKGNLFVLILPGTAAPFFFFCSREGLYPALVPQNLPYPVVQNPPICLPTYIFDPAGIPQDDPESPYMAKMISILELFC